MKSLLVYLKGYVKESIFAPLFKLLEASFELIVPLVIASIIDKGIVNGDTSYILGRSGILVFLAVIGMIAAITAQYLPLRQRRVSAGNSGVPFTVKFKLFRLTSLITSALRL